MVRSSSWSSSAPHMVRVTSLAKAAAAACCRTSPSSAAVLSVEAASLEAAVLVDSAAEEAVAVLPHAARDSAIKAAVASASCFFIIILLHLLYHKLFKVAHHRCATLFHNLRIHDSIFGVNVHNQHVLPRFLVHFSQPVTLFVTMSNFVCATLRNFSTGFLTTISLSWCTCCAHRKGCINHHILQYW